MANFKTFDGMASTLRAGAAAGMRSQITLEPDSAIVLAEILETYGKALELEIESGPDFKLCDWPKCGCPDGAIKSDCPAVAKWRAGG